MSWRFEPLHTPLPLAGGLMGIFGAVVEITMLTVFYARQHLTLCRTVAFQLIGDDHTGYVLQPLEQLAKELLRRVLIPPTLHQDIEHIPLLAR